MKTIPKIRGYVAAEKHRIVLLYRKSNKVTYLISLDYQRHKEYVQVGSRFYGRIYPNRCDISPDGTYFLYFAMGGSQKNYDKRLYCWTGICMPPSLSANMLFAHGDTWGGGGRFIDDRTIFISPGMYPDFDKTQNFQFDKYKIAFAGVREDGGWTSGKGWKLVETQIDPQYGDKYPIPKTWAKSYGKLTLTKSLNYGSFLKQKDGQTMGEYDLHNYRIKDSKKEIEYSLDDDAEGVCRWADFDNFGRTIAARGSKIYIFQTLKEVTCQRPYRVIDLEEKIISLSRK